MDSTLDLIATKTLDPTMVKDSILVTVDSTVDIPHLGLDLMVDIHLLDLVSTLVMVDLLDIQHLDLDQTVDIQFLDLDSMVDIPLLGLDLVDMVPSLDQINLDLKMERTKAQSDFLRKT